MRTLPTAVAAMALIMSSLAQAQVDGSYSPPKALDLKQLFRVVTRCPTNPDPSYVNGYMAFEDPATGRPWMPTTDQFGAPLGRPSVDFFVFFRSRSNPDDVMSLRAANGEGIMQGGAQGIVYVVRLNADRNAGRPTKPPERNPLVITYNPDQWCFDRIEIDRNTTRNGLENLRQRERNFATLPDLPVCRTDGYCLDR